jgi:hypothetical protein
MRLLPEPTLRLWEESVARPAEQRERLLIGSPARSLAERNALALRRYSAMFGPAVEVLGRCPHCGASVEFVIDADVCAMQLDWEEPNSEWHELEVDGERARFRLPRPADLQALQSLDDPQAFAEQLLLRCVEGGITPSESMGDAISRRMEALSSGSSVHFAIHCPDCEQDWLAPLDPPTLLWHELRLRAEQVLGEVATLASRWGWSERDILQMNPVRRAAYLQLATQ